MREFCGGDPDLACLPYAGAGPYPQMYMFESDEDLAGAAKRKKEQFIDLFGRYLEALRPRYAMPFAGLYFLGGALRARNEYRGVPDALEVKEKFGDSVVVLEEEYGEIDLKTGEIARRRTQVHDSVARQAYARFHERRPQADGQGLRGAYGLLRNQRPHGGRRGL